MIIDIHVHVAIPGDGDRADPAGPRPRKSLLLRYLERRAGGAAGTAAPQDGQDGVQLRVLNWLSESVVDRAVFLALDRPHHRNGQPDEANTVFAPGNDAVAGLARKHRKALFGASVHPYRHDAIAEVERLIRLGACLLKWIPSAQNIKPDDPRCLPFYEALAHYRLPLLCHVGNEHTLGRFDNALNDPLLLRPALERGVTVIGAHCGASLFLHERSWFPAWALLAREHENFYGDLGAFCLPLRGGALSKIRRDPELLRKVLYGSDFPALVLPVVHLAGLGLARWRRVRAIANPFDRAYFALKLLGLPDEVFSRAGSLLRIAPAETTLGDTNITRATNHREETRLASTVG